MRLTPLAPGDIVDVVAPASKTARAELEASVRALRALGLVPRLPRDIFGPSFLFSNSDAKRLAHLKRALYASDSHILWCVRGGYGAIRLLPAMDKWKKPPRPKILLGYSDITTLHAYFNQRWGWPTLHGPLLDSMGRNSLPPAHKRELIDILFGGLHEVEFAGLKPLNAAARKAKRVRGSVIGGNMAVLQSAMGTPHQLRPRGRILYFEDIGERPHRVDRMLTQFTQAGWFDECRAVVFGDFVLSEASDRRKIWSDVIPRFLQDVTIPVLSGVPVGHDPRRKRTLPFGTPAELKLGPRGGTLRVETGIGFR